MDRHADTAALLLSAWRDPTQKLIAFPAVLAPGTRPPPTPCSAG